MIIRIMRHGDAPFLQSERQLSELGIEESKTMGKWLSEQSKFDCMLVSPLLRAQQTADCVEGQLGKGYADNREAEPFLKPETDPAICAEYLKSLDKDSVLVISHMPLVANLLAYFDPKRSQYFATAAIATIELDKGLRVTNITYLTPQQVQ